MAKTYAQHYDLVKALSYYLGILYLPFHQISITSFTNLQLVIITTEMTSAPPHRRHTAVWAAGACQVSSLLSHLRAGASGLPDGASLHQVIYSVSVECSALGLKV